MEERTRQERLIRRMALFCVLFSLSAVTAMGIYIQNRGDIVLEASGGEAGGPPADEAGPEIGRYEIIETDYLCIPLPEGINGSEVEITDRYVDQLVQIDMENIGTDFYRDAVLTGNSGQVEDVRYGYQDGRVRIELKLNGLYEHQSVFEDGSLYLKFVPPRELYSRILVIDAGHGGTACGTNAYGQMEKDIVLDVVLKLKELLDQTDLKVYYTRLDDSNPGFEERVGLANQSRADLFISVHANGDQNTRTSNGTEVLYNESFFIPGFGSKELAQILQKNVTEKLGSRDRGVTGGDETAYIVKNSKVPTALVELGFLTNKKEAQLLGKNSYRQQAAEGIYQAIMEAFDQLDRTKTTKEPQGHNQNDAQGDGEDDGQAESET